MNGEQGNEENRWENSEGEAFHDETLINQFHT